MDPSIFNKKKLFSFHRLRGGQKGLQNKAQQRSKEQQLAIFSEEEFNPQQYLTQYYEKVTPDKTPEHVDYLQHLLSNTNDLLKTYVYSNHNAFVHATNRTISVENDLIFLHSLINNLRLSINTLPNETISIDPIGESVNNKTQSLFATNSTSNSNRFTMNPLDLGSSYDQFSSNPTFSNQNSTFSGQNQQNGYSNQSIGATTGISGIYNRENLVKVQMFKQNTQNVQNYGQNSPNSPNFGSNFDENPDELLQMPSIKDKYAKYINDITSKRFTDENGAVLPGQNGINITIPTHETINLVELSEDLQSLIFERRLSESVALVELFVVLGVIPPILQFDQSIIDDISTERTQMRGQMKGNSSTSSSTGRKGSNPSGFGTSGVSGANYGGTFGSNGTNFGDSTEDLSKLSIFKSTGTVLLDSMRKNHTIDPKYHYTSLDFVNNGLDQIKTANPGHLRNRMTMTKSSLHENVSTLVNPPVHFRPQTTSSSIEITSNINEKNYLQNYLESSTRVMLSSNDSQELSQARVFDNSLDIVKYNDGQYSFQPLLNLPQLPSSSSSSASSALQISGRGGVNGGSSGSGGGGKNKMVLDHEALVKLAPIPTSHSAIYGFGKQQPPSTWRLQHQVTNLEVKNSKNGKNNKKNGGFSGGSSDMGGYGSTKGGGSSGSSSNNGRQLQQPQLQHINVVTIRNNKVEKNTNLSHHYTKNSPVSLHIGKLVTVLVSLLLDEMTDFIGTQWEQDERLFLLCRLNQHHLALHRYLNLQSQTIQETLKKTRYKGDLRIFTLSICNTVYSSIQSRIRDFKRFFSNVKNNRPPNSPIISDSFSQTQFTASPSSSTTTTMTSLTTTIPNNTYTYLRDDLLAHLSTWILLEVTKLGKLIDSQLLNQDDKFSNFPNCINTIYEASLETEHVLGTTTCSILVQCLHPSIVRTINTISTNIEKEITEAIARDDWTSTPLNFTLVPISIQTPKDLLAKEAVEMLENNQIVSKFRDEKEAVLEQHKIRIREIKKKEKILEKKKKLNDKKNNIGNDGSGGTNGLSNGITDDTTTILKGSKDSDDDDDDENDGGKNNDKNSFEKSTPTSSSSSSTAAIMSALTSSSNLPIPKLPVLPPGVPDIIHDKIRLNVSDFSIQIYRTLLTFSKQLLSVLLCPIWRVSQHSIETVSIDALCNCIDKVTKGIIDVIRKHLGTLFTPLPPDYLEFLSQNQQNRINNGQNGQNGQNNDKNGQNGQNNDKNGQNGQNNGDSNDPMTTNNGFQPLLGNPLELRFQPSQNQKDNQESQKNNQQKKIFNDKNQKNSDQQQQLTSFLPSSKPGVDPNSTKSSLVYRTTTLPTQAENQQRMADIQNFAETVQTTTTSKKSFRPLSETQLAILLNSLSFIAHYVFPYVSLFISVNLCKPIPELLNACYKQKKISITAFEHVVKKKSLFLLRGRWYIQQELQYKDQLEQQRQMLEKLTIEKNVEQLRQIRDSIIPLPNFKEQQDNLNTLHLPFNGALFWCEGEELNKRYSNLSDFPGTPGVRSISSHMFSFLCHIFQLWHSYIEIFTPHQARYIMRLLIDEICTGLFDKIGWDVIFPNRNSSLYMISDIKVMLYFSFGLFGIFEETKGKRDHLVRRIVRIYSREYISSYLREYKQQKILERKQLVEGSNGGVGGVGGGNGGKVQDGKDGGLLEGIGEGEQKDKNDKNNVNGGLTRTNGGVNGSNTSGSSSSSSSTSTITTLSGKTTTTTTKTTTSTSSSSTSSSPNGTTITTSSMTGDSTSKGSPNTTTISSFSPQQTQVPTKAQSILGLAQSTALLAAATSVRAMSMDDLNDERFLEARTNEIELTPEYYKNVTKVLLEYCNKNYLKK